VIAPWLDQEQRHQVARLLERIAACTPGHDDARLHAYAEQLRQLLNQPMNGRLEFRRRSAMAVWGDSGDYSDG